MITPQDFIHKLETLGPRLKLGMVFLALVMLIVGYNWLSFRNMATQEAMDSAQLARNIAQGKGYTTLLLRPYSLFLVKQQRFSNPDAAADPYLVKDMHPDISNPPLYPLVLAGLMKVLPFNYEIPATPAPFWSSGGQFWWHQPDFLIALLNQVMFLTCVYLVYRLGKRLFDQDVAFFCAFLMLGTELFWKFSVSGLSTMLLMLLFLALTWVLVLIESEAREPKHGLQRVLLYAAGAGAITALCGLTRYSFLWLIVPVVIYLVVWSGVRRWLSGSVAFVTFLLIVSPWVARNVVVSGLPFGTVTFTIIEDIVPGFKYVEHRLARSLDPTPVEAANIPVPKAIMLKLVNNLRSVVSTDIPRMAGNWVAGLFLIGLLMTYHSPAISRLRYFVVGTILFMMMVQSLGRTQLSADVPELNSENLLVVLAPLVILFGVAMFYMLLDTIELPIPELRKVLVVGFGFILCLPLFFTVLPPRTARPIVWPPYYPPQFQVAASFTKTNELTMCDIPWGMAWYGQRQCVWLTADGHSDFFAINDSIKPVQCLFLTPKTLDGQFISEQQRGTERIWGNLIANMLCTPVPGREWPKEIRFGIPRADGQRSQLPFNWWQPGWPDILLLTTRKQQAF